MTIDGYDPSDLDTRLEAELSGGDLNTYLDPEERARYDSGERLVDLLSDEQIATILDLDDGEGRDDGEPSGGYGGSEGYSGSGGHREEGAEHDA
jgi:hypothetical protein